MFVWLKLEGVEDTWPLIKEKAVDKKVILVPGQPFSVPGTVPSPYVRAAYSTASPEDIDEALRRLGSLLLEHRAACDANKHGKEVVAPVHPTVRIGLLGYGTLGRYLAEQIRATPGLELAFVWNRSLPQVREAKAAGALGDCILLEELADVTQAHADLVVEVSHPDVSKKVAEKVLASGKHFYVGSPTAFADRDWSNAIHTACTAKSLFVPVGALWGAWDVQRMAELGTLRKLAVTMKFHSHSLKLKPPLDEKLAAAVPGQECILFEGSVRELAPLAPNNVNTMVCAAIASGKALGLDHVQARLVADDSLEAHIISIEAEGPNGFKVETVRTNPAAAKAVTGQLTYASFFASLLNCAKSLRTLQTGIHVC